MLVIPNPQLVQNNTQNSIRVPSSSAYYNTPNKAPKVITITTTVIPFHPASIRPAALFLLNPNGSPWVLKVTFCRMVELTHCPFMTSRFFKSSGTRKNMYWFVFKSLNPLVS